MVVFRAPHLTSDRGRGQELSLKTTPPERVDGLIGKLAELGFVKESGRRTQSAIVVAGHDSTPARLLR
jgi:hypothetical protein